ncbi:PD-(D/E)XK nuclease-like domain-containing protein [Nitrosomonas eutropha]|uniref:PD-(D/E)XK nuclease-like domain-containing protein n=1 Tax=Nitrosomonas eutropha TaxID=916 RepID=UPI0008D6CAFD|nr:PD-(D/E)XK nuclease-like domain-containing protein [Nitrosomonas eutropha]SEJ07495.1 PDDEXK-like protein of unknown function [Nitrosomonas eutropha]
MVATVTQLKPDNGLYQNTLQLIEADEYHKRPEIGHSSLVRIMRSPAHYREYIKNPVEPTANMVLGSAFHSYLLEEEIFRRNFVVMPKFDRRTKEGKELALAWDAENSGKTGLTPEQIQTISEMSSSVRQHPGAASLLNHGLAEISGFWIEKRTEISCKFRPDFLVLDRKTNAITGIVDVKSCIDASADGFSKAIVNLGYDVQAPYYQDGLYELTGYRVPFYFIAVEKEPPYAVAVYRTSDNVMEIGRKKYQAALQLLGWCKEHNTWPAYQPDGVIEEIDLPRWASNFSLEN